MHCALIALTATLLMGQGPTYSPGTSAGSLPVANCFVTAIDEVEVPAREQGVLVGLDVVEGQQVVEGDLLARIDDKQVLMLKDIAKYKLDVAMAETENNVNERFAKATSAVAEAKLRSALDANLKVPNTIPATEIRELALQCEQARLQIEQATHEMRISVITVDVRKAEIEAAEEDVARRQILAPQSGVIEKIHRHKGEWVQPGEPVMQLVRMDTLWIEGKVDAGRYVPADVRGRKVTVSVPLPNKRAPEQFLGTVTFASSKVEVGNRFLIKAEVQNRQDPQTRDWLLRAGLSATMMVELQ